MFRQILQRSTYGKRLLRGYSLLLADRDWPAYHLPGHYYSPAPNLREIEADRVRLFTPPSNGFLGIDLNEAVQLALRDSFLLYYAEVPFPDQFTEPWRYHFDNIWFGTSDAITLYCMMRHYRPSRVVEVGSGFSSAVFLDTSDCFLGDRVLCTFIDPNPERLRTLLHPGDELRHIVLTQRAQDTDLTIFESLGAGDILFIDSSHVAKVGSDVNWLLFEVLPRLSQGVVVHFHDVFYPFEYPEEWVHRGIGWNEMYLLRAFLQFNTRFEIIYFNSFLEKAHSLWFEQHMPLCLAKPGQSLWLRVRATSETHEGGAPCCISS